MFLVFAVFEPYFITGFYFEMLCVCFQRCFYLRHRDMSGLWTFTRGPESLVD